MTNALLTLIRDSWRHGPKVGWFNFRFELGYAVGNFKHARVCCTPDQPCGLHTQLEDH